MLRRLVRILVRLVLVAGVVAAIGAGFVVWRVRQGPVPLDFLVPRIKAALAEGDEGWQVDLDGLDLVWTAAQRIELHARGLRVGRATEDAQLALESVRLRLRRRALLRGEVVVTAIEVNGPKLQLVRGLEGHLAVQAQTRTGASRGVEWLGSMMRRLDRVAIRDGQFMFVDEQTGTTWAVPQLEADAWRDGDVVRVQAALALRSGEATITAAIDGAYEMEPATLELRVTSPGADTAAAFAAWPSTLAPEAHAWATHQITGGRIHDAGLDLAGHVVAGDGGRLVVDRLDATLDFEGLAVRYVDTMPAVTKVAGHARFTREDLVATVDAGKLEELAVGPARVRVAWPPHAANHIVIEADARGPLPSALAVLDNEPVGLGQRLSFQTRGITGTVATHLQLAFPLDGPPRFGRLGLRASATVTDATIPYLMGDWDAQRLDCTVTVNDHAAALEGTAALRGVPVRIRVRDHFGHPTSWRQEVTGRLDRPERQALGIDRDEIQGPIDVTARIGREPDGRTVADVEADLAPATIDLPPLAVKKAATEPGRLVVRFELARGVVTAVEHVMAVIGAATIRASAGRPPAGGPWDRIDATASFAPADPLEEGAEMQLVMRAAGDESWRTTITSRDLGRLLRVYGYDKARGGHLTFEGTADLRPGTFPFEGTLTAESVTFVGVPWLVKLVSLASITGLLDLGSEQSVAIDHLVGTIAHRPPTIHLDDVTASGPKLGMKLVGTIDRDANALDLQGTLIPSYYLLNQGAERIPVIGEIINRATGGAVQAVSFTVRGAPAEPVVKVQPLSSLAPGVLREWLRKLGL